ncbi:MAG: phosphoribosyl-ATP pyrophosphohydrolase/phosphoribosyl-AMP cyclohydrolase, partial [Crocinitomix sp.]
MKAIKYTNGLVSAIIQDSQSREVLMLGYMNKEALDLTLETKKVTFYSRSKKRLWMKGEESGNTLALVSIQNDCDSDALLLQVIPAGPTCHKGTTTCWGNIDRTNFSRIEQLEDTIKSRIQNP